MADISSKHEIMRMLLSSPNPPPKILTNCLGKMDEQKNSESDSDTGPKLSAYLEQLTGKPDDINVVEMDHTYSLPWHSRPENSFAKPAKLLFFPRTSKSYVSVTRTAGDEVVDVVGVEPPPKPAYDAAKGTHAMDETTRLISILRSDPGDPEWDHKIDRSGWRNAQIKLFERMTRLLNLERLSRLASKGSWNEPLQRRISLDKATRRFRTALSLVNWKPHITVWLHNLLLDHLHFDYLVIYIDILQSLHKKVPMLLERLLSEPNSSKINTDALKMLLRKAWDPTASGLHNFKPRRLPGNPLLVIVPFGYLGPLDSSPRAQRWIPHLANIGTVVPVNTNSTNKVSVVTSLEHMMSATRAKLAELRSEYGGKPIVLVGINSGSALACQVALIEQVTAVICLGFPVNTVDDKRGQADDNLLNLNTPTLFIIGQCAASSYVDDIEDIREKLRVETGLVVIGSADDQLRITRGKQQSIGLRQNMLDKCVVDEVGDFIGTVLSAPKQPPPAPVVVPVENRSKFKVVEKKRKINIQDDLYPRKPYTTNNRRGGTGRGRGRTRYASQPAGGGVAISRRGGLTDKGITRPSIENISVINTSNIDHTTLSGDSSIKILPHIKVLGTEGFTGIDAGDSFPIDQLTPDRLLEMPVIIATDNQEPQDSQLKVVMGPGDEKLVSDMSQKITLNRAGGTSGDVKCATIYLRKQGSVFQSNQVSTTTITPPVRKPRLQHFPATQYQL